MQIQENLEETSRFRRTWRKLIIQENLKEINNLGEPGENFGFRRTWRKLIIQENLKETSGFKRTWSKLVDSGEPEGN